MRITQIMLSQGFGGAERYFADLAIALAERDHQLQVVCNKRFHDMERLQCVPGITMFTLNAAGWWDPVALYRTKRAIMDFSPDVVHAHLSRAAHIAGKATKDLNIPLVVKTHNYVNLKYYRNVDCFIATTNDQRRYLLDNNVSDDKVVVIPNFSLFPCVEITRPRIQDHAVFVSYGRMVKKKGFDVLLKAFRKLCDTGVNARLKLGGEGPEQKILQQLAKKLELQNQVTFHGWVKDVRSFLADADIFVLPSLDEPFGIVILEIMSNGMPIITTNTKGPSEILDDDLGYIVEVGNDAALSEKMSHVISNHEEALSKARLALVRYKNEYSGAVVIPRIEDVYNRICYQTSK